MANQYDFCLLSGGIPEKATLRNEKQK